MRRRVFLAAVLIHALVLIGWAASLETARARSVTVRLEVVQRDPRDLLRGDYIHLGYKIADIPVSAFATSPAGVRPGARVYVALAPRGEVWEVAAASFSKEKLWLASGQRLIVGTFQRQGREGVHVFYGIENYYVREGKGTPPRGKMEAEVALTAAGTPLLTRLYVNGRPYP